MMHRGFRYQLTLSNTDGYSNKKTEEVMKDVMIVYNQGDSVNPPLVRLESQPYTDFYFKQLQLVQANSPKYILEILELKRLDHQFRQFYDVL